MNFGLSPFPIQRTNISHSSFTMDRRTNEVPMDFEWQTHGPADVTSPFHQLTQRQGLKREFPSPVTDDALLHLHHQYSSNAHLI